MNTHEQKIIFACKQSIFDKNIKEDDSLVLYASGEPCGKLTIRDFSSSQLHIHEGPGGSANIKPKGGTSSGVPISSYDAAMADITADNLDIPKLIRNDSSTRRGR